MFLHNYRFDFDYRVLNGKLYSFVGAFDEKTIDSDPCFKIFLVQKFQKVLLILIYLDVHTHFSR